MSYFSWSIVKFKMIFGRCYEEGARIVYIRAIMAVYAHICDWVCLGDICMFVNVLCRCCGYIYVHDPSECEMCWTCIEYLKSLKCV